MSLIQTVDQIEYPETDGRPMGETEPYEPSGEYLDPPLQGFRLQKRGYRRIQGDETGPLLCQRLGITLRLKERSLELRDAQSNQVLPTEAEAKEAAREASENARQASEAARQAAELRAAALEAEVQRLRAKLLEKDA